MSYRSICFVIMPFGRKPDASGRDIDFDAVYKQIIEPAVMDVGFEPVRADEEVNAGLIHKAMYERLMLSEFAIADLTIFNPNVYYELGVRHALRPQTTVLIAADASRLPFDVGYLRTLPYTLDETAQPKDAAGARAALAKKLEDCKTHGEDDSPLFKLLDGLKPPEIDHSKTDVFREQVTYSRDWKNKLTASPRPQGRRAPRRARSDQNRTRRYRDRAGGRRDRPAPLLPRRKRLGQDDRALSRHGPRARAIRLCRANNMAWRSTAPAAATRPRPR